MDLTPKSLDLSLTTHAVLAYWEEGEKASGLTDNFSNGYDRGAGRAALRLWEHLTGLHGDQALEYARQVAASSTTAAVAPF